MRLFAAFCEILSSMNEKVLAIGEIVCYYVNITGKEAFSMTSGISFFDSLLALYFGRGALLFHCVLMVASLAVYLLCKKNLTVRIISGIGWIYGFFYMCFVMYVAFFVL